MEDYGLEAPRGQYRGGSRQGIPAQVKYTKPVSAVQSEISAAFARNPEFLKNAAGKKSKLTDTTLIIAKDVSDKAGVIEMITNQTVRSVGESSLDKNFLEYGRNFVIRKARVLYTSDGGVTKSVKTADWFNNDVMSAALINAELTIKQNNEVIISLPFTDLQAHKYIDFRDIFDRPMLVHSAPISIEVRLPEGTSIPASVDGKSSPSFLRIELQGGESNFKV